MPVVDPAAVAQNPQTRYRSGVGDAQDAIEKLLASRVELAGVRVMLDWPDSPADLPPEAVIVGVDISEWGQEWATTGVNAQREEDFAVSVYVVVRSARPIRDVRDRALVLAGEVEKAIRDDEHLRSKVFEADVHPKGISSARDGEGEKVVQVQLDVQCKAFISRDT